MVQPLKRALISRVARARNSAIARSPAICLGRLSAKNRSREKKVDPNVVLTREREYTLN
jgi:hypothetical protein